METLRIVGPAGPGASAGTDDCIRIRANGVTIRNVDCESFSRDGFRIDSSGGMNANAMTLDNVRGITNLGDCIHFVAGIDNNAGKVITPLCSYNSGWGINIENGSDNVFIGGDMENNKGGGWRVDSGSNTFINPYCEGDPPGPLPVSPPTSSFIITANGMFNRIWFPQFGQCQTISDLSPGSILNEFHYYDASNYPAVSFVAIGPKPGSVSPHSYALLSGNFNFGWFSLADTTTHQNIFAYDPVGKVMQLQAPVAFGLGGNLSAKTVLISTDLPTITSGFGTSALVVNSNGTAAFTVNVGADPVGGTGTLSMPLASTGWNCFCEDLTTVSSSVFRCRQTRNQPPGTVPDNAFVTLSNLDSSGQPARWVANDILSVSCFAR